jgi:hypothetical protein
MSVAAFEFNISLPQGPRYLEMLRDVVLSAARQAGCAEDVAAEFASSVEIAARDVTPDGEAGVAVVVQHADGVMEVRLGSGAGAQALSVRA